MLLKDRNSSEETKSCPYCIGEISVDATKCSHCGEELKEDKEKERLKREGKDTAKREARKQIQDKFKSDKTGKTTQKSIAKSKGIKSWWAAQSTGVKALVILCIGVVALGGTYLASGTGQGTTDSIVNQAPEQSTPVASAETCTVCSGSGKVTCTSCGGDGIIEKKRNM